MTFIESLDIKPGEKRRISIAVPGGAPVDAWVLQGAREGKTLVITAGVHGCEYLGPIAARRAAEKLDPAVMRGRAVIVPMLNPSGFYRGAKQIMPEDGKNLNREFPGDPFGSYSQRLAAVIEKELYPLADMLADLHGGDSYEDLTPLIFFPAAAGEDVERRSLAAARTLTAPLLVASSAANGLYSRAARLGIPALLLERGCRGLWSEEEVSAVGEDIRRLLVSLEIIDGEVPRAEQHEIRRAVYEEAPSCGCWHPAVPAGEKIKEGRLLGELRDIDGGLIRRITAKGDGVVMYVTVAFGVSEGDSLVAYGLD